MNIFALLDSGLLKKSSLHDDKIVFILRIHCEKILLQVLSEDLFMFIFDR